VNKSTILKSKCVGCGDCIRACPVTAIKLDRGKAVVDPEKCVGCRMCVITCSYGAAR
jgi:Fe-S-cluster-containing hydrogenase component 2